MFNVSRVVTVPSNMFYVYDGMTRIFDLLQYSLMYFFKINYYNFFEDYLGNKRVLMCYPQ
jgi:hypothetical protein